MTAREAYETIVAEAEAAGVKMLGPGAWDPGVREAIILMMDTTPAVIPFFLSTARAKIREGYMPREIDMEAPWTT
jgi:hypothetical protein